MISIRLTLLAFLCFPLLSLADGIVFDEYRHELKEMTLEGHDPLTSYRYARTVVMQRLHLEKDNRGYFIEDVYCDQTFRRNVGPNRMPSHTEINVEHTWPQSRFSSRGSRTYQKADLHHLYPSESRSNSTRGNHVFSDLGTRYGEEVCGESKIGYDPKSGNTAFEPPAEHKGNVARALFYFSIRYDIAIPDHEEFYLRLWNYSDPVDAEELRRNDIVESVQGNRNPFIDDPEYAEFVKDF